MTVAPIVLNGAIGVPRRMRQAFRRSPGGFVGGVVFLTICLVAMIGPVLLPVEEILGDPASIYQPPSAKHWLGTDAQGKDIAQLILAGGRDVIVVGLLSAAISTMIAVMGGALAAYRRGWLDEAIVQVTDFFLTVPHFPLLLVLSAYLQLGNPIYLGVLLGLLGWAGLLRSVRAQVLSLRERDFIEASRMVNISTFRIIVRDIVPNMASYLLMYFIMAMTGAVYGLVGLYILGLAPMQGTSWGIMINQAWTRGALFYSGSLSSLLAPLAAVALLQLSAIWFTRSLEQLANPRLQGR